MTKQTIALNNSRYRLGYHVMASSGWINDPNGFCYFKGYYHIFYQHHPYSAQWGPMHWGHARSKDLVHWETLPIGLTPDSPEDEDGCFSGSAIVKDDVLYLIYTGHHYYGDGDQDHFWQNQNLAYSTDGVHFTKYENNPIIATPPQDNTHHFRDPEVWQHEDTFYMILGSQAKDGLGRAILYSSSNLKQWDYLGVLDQSRDLLTEGFMWECPDFFNLAGKDILLLSPQGIQAQKEKYLNLFETGYFVGTFNYQTLDYPRGSFYELDYGHDFYATQTTLTPDGRRIVFAWMAMWESEMPEQQDGWSGALTLPRELTLKNDRLYMTPVKELEALRIDQGQHQAFRLTGSKSLALSQAQTEILLELDLSENTQKNLTVSLVDQQQTKIISLSFDPEKQKFTLTKNNPEDARYATIQKNKKISLQLFIDTSSVEIFINQGEAVFTERYYVEDIPTLQLDSCEPVLVDTTIYALETQTVTY